MAKWENPEEKVYLVMQVQFKQTRRIGVHTAIMKPFYNLSQKFSERGESLVTAESGNHHGYYIITREKEKLNLLRNKNYSFHMKLFMSWSYRTIKDSYLY